VQAARTNQLKWWKDRYEMFNEQEEAASSDEQLHGIRIARLPLAENFARIVCPLLWQVTARIENMFSMAATNKSAVGSRTDDSTVAERLTVKGGAPFADSDIGPFPAQLTFDLDAPLQHRLDW
jgi:hypothetical protein